MREKVDVAFTMDELRFLVRRLKSHPGFQRRLALIEKPTTTEALKLELARELKADVHLITRLEAATRSTTFVQEES